MGVYFRAPPICVRGLGGSGPCVCVQGVCAGCGRGGAGPRVSVCVSVSVRGGLGAPVPGGKVSACRQVRAGGSLAGAGGAGGGVSVGC